MFFSELKIDGKEERESSNSNTLMLKDRLTDFGRSKLNPALLKCILTHTLTLNNQLHHPFDPQFKEKRKGTFKWLYHHISAFRALCTMFHALLICTQAYTLMLNNNLCPSHMHTCIHPHT